MCFEPLLTGFGIESRRLLEGGPRLVVAPELQQGRSNAVEYQTLVNAVLASAAKPERDLVVTQCLGVVAILPAQKPEGVTERAFALVITRGDRAPESALVNADRSAAHSALARASRNSLQSDGFAGRILRFFATLVHSHP